MYISFSVIYKSYRQVLTLIHNSQLLSKLPILDNFRLATLHKVQHKETTVSKLVLTSSGEMRVLMTLNQAALSEDEQCLSTR
jgi:hypothetical protein